MDPRLPSPPPSPWTRRTFLGRSSALAGLGVLGGAGLLAACSDGGDGNDQALDDGGGDQPGTGDADPDAPVLGEGFDRNALLIAGAAQRAAYLLYRADGGFLEDPPAEVPFRLEPLDGGEPLEVLVARHGGDDVPNYYPLTTTFPAAGTWSVTATLPSGAVESSVTVSEPDQIRLPQVGDPLPTFASPTVAAPADTETLCTADPQCPFHEVSLADALASGAPVVLMVSTPAFCDTAVCGPVLDLLVEAAPQHPDATVIHLEVYPGGPPSAETIAPQVEADLGMTFEPSLFVTDTTGTVTARLDNVWDRPELTAALSTA